MNPLRLLQLWRERWGEDDFSTTRIHAPSYERATAWGGSLTQAPLWSIRGATVLVLLLALALLAFGAMTVLDRPQQVVLAAAMVALGFYVRRQPGTLAMLMLSGLALLAGARYLAWRALHAIPSGDAQLPGILAWLAELCLLLGFATWLMTVIWPLYRTQGGAPVARGRWPYLDVVLQPGAMDVTRVQALAALVAGQEWPGARMRIFVQRDGVVGPELARFVEARGYSWIEGTGPLPMPLDSNGEYLVLVGDADGIPMLRDPQVLQRWTTWLRNDGSLALVHSAAHPLASPLSEDAARLLDDQPYGRLALVRRGAVERIGMHAARNAATLDVALEDAGYRTAAVGHPMRGKGAAQPAEGDPRDWLRIDDPANGASVRMRAQFAMLSRWLAACMPVALAVLAFMVLMIPLAGATPINASFGWFASYAAPYAILAFLAWNRAHVPYQRSLWRDLLDWLQAAILPFTVGAQALRAYRNGLQQRFDEAIDDAPVASPLPWLLVAALLVAVVLLRYDAADAPMRPWLVFAALLATYAAVLQLAQWAVEQEVRTLRHLHAAQRRIEAVVRLPDRHLLPATTRNFPEEQLDLEFTDQTVALPDNGPYIVTLSTGQASATVRGTAARMAAGQLRFQPSADDLPDYQRFAASVRDGILRNRYWLPSTPPTPRWLRTLGLANQTRGD